MHFVEISPLLERRQKEFLGGVGVPLTWHQSLNDVPEGPMIILANEFFDSLPVHQAVMCADGWHERVVKIDENQKLRFGIARDPIPLFEQLLPRGMRAEIGAVFEWRADQTALEVGRRVKHSEGAALVIDYGHAKSAPGETLQAVGKHQYADPLVSPGLVDLTAHVDFQALAEAAESMGARALGPVDQGEFLRRLGIELRAMALKNTAPPSKVMEIERALGPPHRLRRPQHGTAVQGDGLQPPQARPPARLRGLRARIGSRGHDRGAGAGGAARHPARLLHPHRRGLHRNLCQPQRRHRLARLRRERGGEPRPHGGGARRAAALRCSPSTRPIRPTW